MQDENNRDLEPFRNQQLRSAQTLLTIAMISAPVSLLIGGVLLGTVAIICACVARGKIKSVLALDPEHALSLGLYRQSTIALWMSISACVINLIFTVIAFNQIMQAFSSGDINGHLDSMMGGGQQAPGGQGSSVWDS